MRVAPRGDDEVAALAGAFNAMADRLARDEQWRRDMTSDLSHELRTPLATIQSRVEALEDGVLPPTPENLRVIGEEVERLGRLLGALRSLNELESEDLSVEHEPVDLADVAAAAADRHRPGFAMKGVELTEELRPGVVFGDRDRLLQVVGNLLDNALKFTPAGGHVVMTVDAVDGPGEQAGALAGPVGAVARLTVTRRRPRGGSRRPAVHLRPLLPGAGRARHGRRRPRPRHLPRPGGGAGRVGRPPRMLRAAAPGSPCCCRPPAASEASLTAPGISARGPVLLACDLDGTLLDHEAAPVPGAGEALTELIAAGALFVVCTGRPLQAARRATVALGVQPVVFACYHGALVVEASGRILRHQPLPAAEAREIAAEALAAGVAVTVWDVDEPRELEPGDARRRAGRRRQPARPAWRARHRRAGCSLRCEQEWAGRLRVEPIRPGFLGVFAPAVDKGDALRFVAGRLGVPLDRTVACGDGRADETLLAAAAVRVAVGETPHALGQLPEVVVTSWARLPDTLRALVLPML